MPSCAGDYEQTAGSFSASGSRAGFGGGLHRDAAAVKDWRLAMTSISVSSCLDCPMTSGSRFGGMEDHRSPTRTTCKHWPFTSHMGLEQVPCNSNCQSKLFVSASHQKKKDTKAAVPALALHHDESGSFQKFD